MKYYKVSEADLLHLLARSNMLDALFTGDVINWEWYDKSMDDYFEGNTPLETAKIDIDSYESVDN